MPGLLSSIHRFPLKSCRGESVDSAVVEPWGLRGDRRWMVVGEDGRVVTAREVNHLLLLRPELTITGLRVSTSGMPDLEVALPDPAEQVPVELWSSRLTAAAAGDEADAWFTEAIGRPARLVYLDDPTRRPTSPEFSRPTDRLSFADGYPLLLANQASLEALNEVVLAGSAQPRDPLPMTRFRPSVVISGVEAWAEDDWRVIRIGEAVFRAVKGCARCVITTVDPDTGIREKEPIASLAKTRRWDGATWFGINLVPDTYGVPIRVGDDFEVLEAVPAGGGPIRPKR